MIIVKLMGGLGNQMFQYAAARSLSMLHGSHLKLDLSFLEGEQPAITSRAFELDHFSITAEIASRWEVTMKSGRGASALSSTCARLLQKAAGFSGYREKNFNFDPRFLTLPDNIYLEGYWQSERYFSNIGGIIQNEFSLISPLSVRNLDLAEEIDKVNAVSVHVRRGDYVTDINTNAIHGVCNLEYYLKAEEKIVRTLKDPHFFVFSDDPEWVENNLKLSHPTRYINHNGRMAHEDLRLMSLCRHHIIANSSFSWWGAWLNPRPDKLVIAPQQWFNVSEIDTSDLIPSSWLRISV